MCDSEFTREEEPDVALPLWAAAITATVTLVVGYATLLQKFRNDRRLGWWQRAQWAIDHAMSPEQMQRTVGWEALTQMAAAHVWDDDDLEFVSRLADRVDQEWRRR